MCWFPDSVPTGRMQSSRPTFVGVVWVESRIKSRITQMMKTTLPSAYSWVGLMVKSHLAITIFFSFLCMGILLFISASCFSRVLWCTESSLKQWHTGFVLHPCITQQGLLFFGELVLLRKQLLVKFLNNVLQSLLATSVLSQHSFMCKKSSLQWHHMWVCCRRAPQRAAELSQHHQSITSTTTFEGQAQGPPCAPQLCVSCCRGLITPCTCLS